MKGEWEMGKGEGGEAGGALSPLDPSPSPPLVIARALVEGMCAHARAAHPEECCGLVGGAGGEARTVYRLRNVSRSPLVAYEAAPEELFAAQREMRGRGEELFGIYHSHPRAAEPVPSPTDVRLAFYPSAVYFIAGLTPEGACVLRAFRIDERAGRWERLSLRVVER